MKTNPQRRRFMKSAGTALALASLGPIGRTAHAGINPTLRAQLQYQDSPKDGKTCLTCLEFIPGASDDAPGGCKRIPGDTEIAPQGFCIAWNTM